MTAFSGTTHYAGVNWAAATRDESAKADLIRSLSYYSDDSYVNGVAYALGRIRAFDVVQSLLEKDFSDMNTLSEAIYMFWGLADIPLGGPGGDCRGDARRDCMHDKLHKTARRERWPHEQLQLAAELLDAVEPIPKTRQFFHFEDTWTPPKALPDMPDPLDKEAITVYLRRNVERCRQIIREGSAEDKFKILKVAWHAQVNLVDSELAVELLVDPDWMVRNAVLISSDGEELSFTPSQIGRWTLTGGYESTRRALVYITGHPKPEYAPIVTKVLFGGRHLFDEILFRAIIETDATECVDLLRSYLENEHFALRVNAAVTLIHLGVEAGESVLAELQPNLRCCSECMQSSYIQDALNAIE
ncbi:MAG: hypothetical protein IIC01_10120 [Planctomycetes bacterium]|nr:hypothetical protein [Planctomycetota bacterium]